MMIHPSLIEKASLDAREHNADVVADIKRSFTYVGPMSVTSHEAAEGSEARNDLRLVCRMSRPYWTDEGDGAAMWESMRSWLAGKAYKVASTMANFNTSRAEAGHQTVHYDRAELDMKPYALGIALTQDDALPAVDELAGTFRRLLGEGVIPADVRGVEMPSAASLARQVEAARAAVAEATQAVRAADGAEAEAAADEQAEQPSGSDAISEALAAAGVAGTADVVKPAAEEVAAAGVAAADGASVEGEAAEDAGATPAEAHAAEADAKQERPRLPHVSDGLTHIDYGVWDVLMADGTTRELDTVAGTWL